SGAVTAISSVISNFQLAKQETTLNAIEHNTRYSMMYVGERADGGILGQMFKLNEEVAFGNLTKATENHRDLFNDWIGHVNPLFESIERAVGGYGPYIADMKDYLSDIKTLTATMSQSIAGDGAASRPITITVNASGITTADAARTLGNQIAANLSTQLVGTTLR